MSDGILHGIRVIEGSAFVAAPTAGMTLAQLGADVIRFDAPGGGLVTLRIEVSAQRADGALDAVLDWRLVGAMA